MTSKALAVEILPPDPNGPRPFEKGGPGGPGRPPGLAHGFTRMMRDAISEAFEEVGGKDYLIMLAYWKPELFTQLVGRAMPIKVVGDDEGIKVINKVTRRIMPAK